jgi:hypothetical protein
MASLLLLKCRSAITVFVQIKWIIGMCASLSKPYRYGRYVRSGFRNISGSMLQQLCLTELHNARLKRGLAVAWSQLSAIRLLPVPIGVGVGIGIGIDSVCVLWLVHTHGVASLP